jgi:hypothetical protein
LASAQDPKPIPYNAKFLGYVQVASLKDKANKSLTNAYVLVDTITGQLYAVSVDSVEVCDTCYVSTTGSGQKIYQSLELLNTARITANGGSVSTGTGGFGIAYNGGAISNGGYGLATHGGIITNGGIGLAVTNGELNAGYGVGINTGKILNGSVGFAANGGVVSTGSYGIVGNNSAIINSSNGITIGTNDTINNSIAAILGASNSRIDTSQNSAILGGGGSYIKSNSAVIINGSNDTLLTSGTLIGQSVYMPDIIEATTPHVAYIDTTNGKISYGVSPLVSDTGLVRTSGTGQTVYQSLELLETNSISNSDGFFTLRDNNSGNSFLNAPIMFPHEANAINSFLS